MAKSKTIITILILTILNSVGFAELPSFFDWHNLDDVDWMSPVADQGDCSSCWAFSAVGTVEAQYNIFFDWPEYNANLSEQQLVVRDPLDDDRCLTEWGRNCCFGGYHAGALRFIRDHGITDEDCFPYVDSHCEGYDCEHGCSDAECPDMCSEWADRLWTIDEVYDFPFNATNEDLKNWIYNFGPISVSIDMVHANPDQYGVYTCPSFNAAEHAVIITGWGFDPGGEYWIVKNSWGSDWNNENPPGGGYFKLRFRTYDPWCGCNMESVKGVILAEPDTDKFIVKNALGEKVAWVGNQGNVVLKGILEKNSNFPETGHSEFVVKKANGEKLAAIDTNNGNMYIKGNAYPNQTLMYPYVFMVISQSFNDHAYIDKTGDLWMTGKLYQNPE